MALCSPEAHGDVVHPGPVAAPAQAVDEVVLDVEPGQRNVSSHANPSFLFTLTTLTALAQTPPLLGHLHQAGHAPDEDADFTRVSGPQPATSDSEV